MTPSDLHDVESCRLCLPGLERLAESIERIRAHHDRTLGHGLTNRLGYCAEPDGISAAYCETGILLAGIEAENGRRGVTNPYLAERVGTGARSRLPGH